MPSSLAEHGRRSLRAVLGRLDAWTSVPRTVRETREELASLAQALRKLASLGLPLEDAAWTKAGGAVARAREVAGGRSPANDPAAPPAASGFRGMDVGEIREQMNARYQAGTAYRNALRWDVERGVELARAVRELALEAGPLESLSILDLGCGEGGVINEVRGCREYVGVELSEIAVERARAAYGAPNVRYVQGDITGLDFPDGSFDVVVAREVIEHVPEPERCVAEMARVLKPGGRAVLSTPNRDSLHLRMNRALGRRDFLCSSDHVKELTYPELVELVQRSGLRVVASRGVFLMPYWGIPGVDDPVRRLTDEDPEVVALLRDLGRRVGAEHAFCSVVAAEKAPAQDGRA